MRTQRCHLKTNIRLYAPNSNDLTFFQKVFISSSLLGTQEDTVKVSLKFAFSKWFKIDPEN